MADVAAYVPFFGGRSSAAHSKEESRLADLEATVESVRQTFGVEPTVVQWKKDRVDVPGSVRLKFDNPVWLPYHTVQHALKETSEFVYYTEADQIVSLEDSGVFDRCTEDSYVAPWRLAEIPPGMMFEDDVMQHQIDGVRYSVSSGGSVPRGDDPAGFIEFCSSKGSFSGAWLARRDFLRRVKWRRMHVLPVEHTSGFDLLTAGHCYRTARLERFWINHLSAREYLIPESDDERIDEPDE